MTGDLLVFVLVVAVVAIVGVGVGIVELVVSVVVGGESMLTTQGKGA